MTETLLVAVVAGMVATVNPCGFAMLPAYLTLVVTGAADRTRAQLLARALGSSALMTLGFVTVFGLFGIVIAPVFASVQRYLPFVTVVIGAALVVLGALLLAGREITLLVPKPRKGAPNQRLASMFGYGIAYAIASLSCTIGPFLAVAGTSLRGGDVVEGVAAFVAYAAGMGPQPAAAHLPNRRRTPGARRPVRHLLRHLRTPAVPRRRRPGRPGRRRGRGGAERPGQLAHCRRAGAAAARAGGVAGRCHAAGAPPQVSRPEGLIRAAGLAFWRGAALTNASARAQHSARHS
jgi:cytochrome c-type biogenesis protein